MSVKNSIILSCALRYLAPQVSAWLGVDADAVLEQETDPAIEAMFTKPHPQL
jgi:hypothetical protein